MQKKMMVLMTILAVALSACGVDVVSEDAARSPNYALKPWENVKLTWASMSYYQYTDSYDVYFQGQILVRDLAYNKVVAIRYTTDGWQTWKDLNAKYAFKQGDQETWRFVTGMYNFPCAGPWVSITEAVDIDFDFAVYYKVNGVTYWDSNGGSNFHLDQNVRYITR